MSPALELVTRQRAAATVAWVSGGEAGVRFRYPIDVLALINRTLVSQPTERRSMPRVELRCAVRVRWGASICAGVLRNISGRGMQVQAEELPAKGTFVSIQIDGFHVLCLPLPEHPFRRASHEFFSLIALMSFEMWGKRRQSEGESEGRCYSAVIAKTIAAVILLALLLSSTGLYWAARESDAVSAERQARSAQHAMELSVDELALQQETVAIWDDSAAHMIAAQRDATWIHDNIGSWLHRIFGHDEVFILDHADQPIYASVGGQQRSPRRFSELSADLRFLVRSVRGADGGMNGRHDRNPRQPLLANSTVRTTGRATHDSHMMLVGGRPAAASAMLIQPSTPGYVQPKGRWPVLISVRYLDAGFLDELNSRQLISSPRFSPSADYTAGEQVIPLRTEWGTTIGHLAWKPELPGTRILWRLAPVALVVLVCLASFMTLLGMGLKRAMAQLSSAQAQAAHLAFHDAFTGLPNRAFFQRRLEDLITDPNGRFTLLLLDVDEFKLINDTMGHDAGDAVLLAIANRLKEVVAPEDLVARLGGDEFALLLPGMNDRKTVEGFANDLFSCLNRPCDHEGKLIHAHASIGASIYTGSACSENMLKHADLALYEAKNAGRGVFRMYEPAMWSGVHGRQKMLSLAKSAIEANTLKPFYQPKVDLRTGEIVGFEALLRCCERGKAATGPDRIAAAFEDSTLAAAISDLVIGNVIEDICVWRAAGLPFGHVAINAAAAELRRGDFAKRLLARLKEAAIPPEFFQVEVTESVLVGRGIDHVERTFKELAASGVKLALDDFGTGFASLTHLKRFPVQIMKIDRTFIRDLQVDPEDGAIVDALVELGKTLGIEVVAEGIETKAQRDFLWALGCPIGQGFLFGNATPASRVPNLLRRPAAIQNRAAA